MNAALWKKTLLESRWLLLGSITLMFCVHWLRVWVSSYFELGDLKAMLNLLPEFAEQLLPVPVSQIATAAGRIAVAYDDPVVLLTITVWAISRGSDAVSGELNRGTMEMLLAQPVTRQGVLGSQAGVTLLGAALLASAALLGTSIGLATVPLEETVAPRVFLPAALNVFAMTVFLAGLTTLVSSRTDVRSQTIGIVGGFYAVSLIMKVIGRLVPGFHWLAYCSFFTPFEPQLFVNTDKSWALWIPAADHSFELGALGYDSILIGLGLAAYLAATVVFCRRDLPAPL